MNRLSLYGTNEGDKGLIIHFREWNCDICKADVEAIEAILANDAAAAALVQALSGPLFCQDPNLGLNEEQMAGCASYVEAFLPTALRVLFKDAPPPAEELCNFYFNQCRNKSWWE